jgi:hypothetical protein
LPLHPLCKDDDVPIAQTLASQCANLSMLASFASKPSPSSCSRKKKERKNLWHYETVAEPTGISFKYWDADAPMERATKRRAIEKLSAVYAGNENESGALTSVF